MVPSHSGMENGILYLSNDPNTDIQVISGIVCISIAVLLMIPFFCIHFGRLYYVYRKSKIELELDHSGIHLQDIFPSKKNKIELGVSYYYIWSYHILTILSIILSIFAIIAAILIEIFHVVLINCTVSVLLMPFSHYFVKICVYIIGILRIFNTFNGSYFDYTKKCKVFLMIYLCIAIIYTLMCFTLFSKGYEIIENGVFKWCQFGANVIALGFSSIIEVSMNVIICFLFIRPGLILSKNADTKPES